MTEINKNRDLLKEISFWLLRQICLLAFFSLVSQVDFLITESSEKRFLLIKTTFCCMLEIGKSENPQRLFSLHLKSS